MWTPPFIQDSRAPGNDARVRTLLVRAGGIVLVLLFLPKSASALGSVIETVIWAPDPTLSSPGVGGYVDLGFQRLHRLDLWDLFLSSGHGVAGVAIGGLLILRRHRGPVWRGGAG